MRLNLEVQRIAENPTPNDTELRRWATLALGERRKATALVIRLVDISESALLNQTYRGKTGPTNVLSFPFEAPPPVRSSLLGDLVICVPLVAQEAVQQGKLLNAHWAHLVIHGVLHLLGYDHLNDSEALIMENRERTLLTALGYVDPYTMPDVQPF